MIKSFPILKLKRATAVQFVLAGLTVGSLSGQEIKLVPSRLGLDLVASTSDPETSTVRISAVNSGKQPITAFAIRLRATYADGSVWSGDTRLEYFPSLGQPVNPAAKDWGGLAPGDTRVTTARYQEPPPGDSSVRLSAEVAAVVYDDRTAAGDPDVLAGIFEDRAVESAELDRWCRQIPGIFGRPVARTDVTALIGLRAAETSSSTLSPHEASLRRKIDQQIEAALVSAFDSAGRTSAVFPDSLGVYLNTRCSASREHSVRAGGVQ